MKIDEKTQETVDIQSLFASPFRDRSQTLEHALLNAVQQIQQLKPAEEDSSAFLGKYPDLNIDISALNKSKLKTKGESLDEVSGQIVGFFEGLPNWGHPLNMSNICPQENLAAIIASMLTQVFSPNILEAEYAWNTATAELESAAILSNMAGWNAEKSGGLYTYGGSGCWLYHLKYALSRVLPGSRYMGIRTDAKILCSEQAHYAMLNSSDWTGLGMNNLVKIKTAPGKNTIDLDHLEELLQEFSSQNIPVVSVICTMATTDACAFDPVKKVRELLDQYPNRAPYGKTFLYCDAVIGWAWLAFKEYDFNKNPLQFSQKVLHSAKKNLEAISEIEYADAFGVDFHKTFAPLTSSMFVYKNKDEFEQLLNREEAAYLQERGDYNPHQYTLEVSRNASGSMAGWATLKYLGAEGIQSILAHGLHNKNILLEKLDDFNDMVCVNDEDHGSVALIRIYPEHIDAKNTYEQELFQPLFSDQLALYNDLTQKIGDLLWKWFRERKTINGLPTAYLSFTKGFRTTRYEDSTEQQPVYALKIYPVSVFVNDEHILHAIRCIRAAREEIINPEAWKDEVFEKDQL